MTIETYEDLRKREKQAELAEKYRKIGPAAILAALVCQQRGTGAASATKAA